ncbi:MAG: cysteine desulfurase family protein [Bacteroidota bacterium]
MRVYFDNAATTQLDPAVIDAMTKVMQENYGNPSSIHREGRTSRSIIEKARKAIAKCINASIGEIFFTSGGTESSNMALKCSVRDLGVQRIITSRMEHHCVLHTAESLEKTHGIEVAYVDIDNCGRVDYVQLESLLSNSDKKTLVSLMHANNEIGTVMDMERISSICQANNALFHSDTVQTIGHFPIDVEQTKINFLTGAAHKFHGPKGVGFIYINGETQIKPYIDGGAQERNMRGGTENFYGIVGIAKALEMSVENMEHRRNHIESIRQYMKDQLTENFEDVQFNGCQENYLYTVLSVSFPPHPKADMMMLNLDIAGISASGGSACSSGAEKGSHVLESIQAPSDRKTIRFSFSHYNTKEEVDFLIERLKSIIAVKQAAIV